MPNIAIQNFQDNQLQKFEQWYDPDSIRYLVHLPNPNSRNVYYVFYDGGLEPTDLNGALNVFENQFRQLTILRNQLGSGPVAHFVAKEPGGHGVHYVYGSVFTNPNEHGINLLLVNPVGNTNHDDFCTSIQNLHKLIRFNKIYISNVQIQREGDLSSCGPICVELLKHFSTLSSDELSKSISTNVEVVEQGGLSFISSDITSILPVSLSNLLSADQKAYADSILAIRKQHADVLALKEVSVEHQGLLLDACLNTPEAILIRKAVLEGQVGVVDQEDPTYKQLVQRIQQHSAITVATHNTQDVVVVGALNDEIVTIKPAMDLELVSAIHGLRNSDPEMRYNAFRHIAHRCLKVAKDKEIGYEEVAEFISNILKLTDLGTVKYIGYSIANMAVYRPQIIKGVFDLSPSNPFVINIVLKSAVHIPVIFWKNTALTIQKEQAHQVDGQEPQVEIHEVSEPLSLPLLFWKFPAAISHHIYGYIPIDYTLKDMGPLSPLQNPAITPYLPKENTQDSTEHRPYDTIAVVRDLLIKEPRSFRMNPDIITGGLDPSMLSAVTAALKTMKEVTQAMNDASMPEAIKKYMEKIKELGNAYTGVRSNHDECLGSSQLATNVKSLRRYSDTAEVVNQVLTEIMKPKLLDALEALIEEVTKPKRDLDKSIADPRKLVNDIGEDIGVVCEAHSTYTQDALKTIISGFIAHIKDSETAELKVGHCLLSMLKGSNTETLEHFVSLLWDVRDQSVLYTLLADNRALTIKTTVIDLLSKSPQVTKILKLDGPYTLGIIDKLYKKAVTMDTLQSILITSGELDRMRATFDQIDQKALSTKALTDRYATLIHGLETIRKILDYRDYSDGEDQDILKDLPDKILKHLLYFMRDSNNEKFSVQVSLCIESVTRRAKHIGDDIAHSIYQVVVTGAINSNVQSFIPTAIMVSANLLKKSDISDMATVSTMAQLLSSKSIPEFGRVYLAVKKIFSEANTLGIQIPESTTDYILDMFIKAAHPERVYEMLLVVNPDPKYAVRKLQSWIKVGVADQEQGARDILNGMTEVLKSGSLPLEVLENVAMHLVDLIDTAPDQTFANMYAHMLIRAVRGNQQIRHDNIIEQQIIKFLQRMFHTHDSADMGKLEYGKRLIASLEGLGSSAPQNMPKLSSLDDDANIPIVPLEDPLRHGPKSTSYRPLLDLEDIQVISRYVIKSLDENTCHITLDRIYGSLNEHLNYLYDTFELAGKELDFIETPKDAILARTHAAAICMQIAISIIQEHSQVDSATVERFLEIVTEILEKYNNMHYDVDMDGLSAAKATSQNFIEVFMDFASSPFASEFFLKIDDHRGIRHQLFRIPKSLDSQGALRVFTELTTRLIEKPCEYFGDREYQKILKLVEMYHIHDRALEILRGLTIDYEKGPEFLSKMIKEISDAGQSTPTDLLIQDAPQVPAPESPGPQPVAPEPLTVPVLIAIEKYTTDAQKLMSSVIGQSLISAAYEMGGEEVGNAMVNMMYDEKEAIRLLNSARNIGPEKVIREILDAIEGPREVSPEVLMISDLDTVGEKKSMALIRTGADPIALDHTDHSWTLESSRWTKGYSQTLKRFALKYLFKKEVAAVQEKLKSVLLAHNVHEAPDLLGTAQDFRRETFQFHPDKGGNKEIFTAAMNCREEVNRIAAKKALEVQVGMYKATFVMKASDTVVGVLMWLNQPTPENAKKVVLDTVHVYGMYKGLNGYGIVTGGLEAAYQAYKGEYSTAAMQVVMTGVYMGLPYAMVAAGVPQIGLIAFGALMTGYHLASHSHSLYTEYTSHENAVKSAASYADFYRFLAKTPLQYVYKFDTSAEGQSNVELIQEQQEHFQEVSYDA
ncbi:hypothetical protein [Rickettsiales endosymbiont of Peranema trichophorum]|uniref:hypothetical protein n=1 Tax=Rickettsiales endosymbiont of Peranema trichophorum TaxID=2486577 RepID=UPI0013EEE8C4|nr:hypothetical protein [Rickettsiales endosymbiont of Peranema trichophorum]